jgi:hypothetical protein
MLKPHPPLSGFRRNGQAAVWCGVLWCGRGRKCSFGTATDCMLTMKSCPSSENCSVSSVHAGSRYHVLLLIARTCPKSELILPSHHSGPGRPRRAALRNLICGSPPCQYGPGACRGPLSTARDPTTAKYGAHLEGKPAHIDTYTQRALNIYD